jgi:hypothetical protein
MGRFPPSRSKFRFSLFTERRVAAERPSACRFDLSIVDKLKSRRPALARLRCGRALAAPDCGQDLWLMPGRRPQAFLRVTRVHGCSNRTIIESTGHLPQMFRIRLSATEV